MIRRMFALSAGISLLAGCATTAQSQWTPTVDTYGSSRAQYLSRDLSECRALAMQVSGNISEQAIQGGVQTGLLGAAGGAAIGGILGGGAGRGAAAGGAIGALAGGAAQGAQTEAQFQRAFNDCMRRRGHNVIN